MAMKYCLRFSVLMAIVLSLIQFTALSLKKHGPSGRNRLSVVQGDIPSFKKQSPPTARPKSVFFALKARFSSSISNFFICLKAFVTLSTFCLSLSCNMSSRISGTICHEHHICPSTTRTSGLSGRHPQEVCPSNKRTAHNINTKGEGYHDS